MTKPEMIIIGDNSAQIWFSPITNQEIIFVNGHGLYANEAEVLYKWLGEAIAYKKDPANQIIVGRFESVVRPETTTEVANGD